MFNFERVLFLDVFLRKHIERFLDLLHFLVIHFFVSLAAFAILDHPKQNEKEYKNSDTDHDHNRIRWETEYLWPCPEGIGARTKQLVTDVWGADDARFADVELHGLLRRALRVIRREYAEELLEKDTAQSYGTCWSVLDWDSAGVADGLRESNQGDSDIGGLVCSEIQHKNVLVQWK